MIQFTDGQMVTIDDLSIVSYRSCLLINDAIEMSLKQGVEKAIALPEAER
ncbi:hypothetical protein [Chamaesiphon minutus]|uniref:Uncharacterized protein n=1 Tax=Chamaesiphon minutus (strain ATCC 27169 / PCC 6605) TaxID=1173020 RepID=K9UD26_CHAP6|nr:hypothetical protein [Chamaesiphon minutus]AFY92311.1 hypothetical protein Cha6605_1080 [Chamaesiphon minutus PCC 6605]